MQVKIGGLAYLPGIQLTNKTETGQSKLNIYPIYGGPNG
jgi:hypothetical protein